MKRAICVLLAIGSGAVLADEPKQSAPPAASQPAAPKVPEGFQWLFPDGRFKAPQSPQLSPFAPGAPAVTRALVTGRSGTCYFIRTIRPVQADGQASPSGFIKLQSRTTSFVRDPVCTGDGALMRATPVVLENAATAGGDSSR